MQKEGNVNPVRRPVSGPFGTMGNRHGPSGPRLRRLLSACRSIAGAELLPTVGQVDLRRVETPDPRRGDVAEEQAVGRVERSAGEDQVVLVHRRGIGIVALAVVERQDRRGAGRAVGYDHGQLVVAGRLGTREEVGGVVAYHRVIVAAPRGRGGEGVDLAVLQVPAHHPQAVAGSCRVDHVLA